MRYAYFGVALVAGVVAAVGCGSSVDTATGTGGAGATSGPGGFGGVAGTGGAGAGHAGGSGGASASGGGGAGFGGGVIAGASCSVDPPPGAKHPPAPKAYSGGTCPTLAAGTNAITSMGNDRSFMLAVPANLMPNEKLPVAFLWHWLGGSAQDFYDTGEVQAAVDTQRFLAVIPSAKGDLIFKWPFEVADTQARMDEEFTFFDDLLSCVSEQFNTNLDCVSSVGVSAGALFTDQLAGGRGDYLASIESLSGGVDGLIKPWGHPAHHMPAMVLWGGPSDFCVVIDFETASKALESALGMDGHFMLECIHNCGHSEPPFEAPPGLSTYAGLWQFVLDHPYWLPTGESPYTANGLPSGMPSWCAIGAGNAVPRTGACNGSGC